MNTTHHKPQSKIIISVIGLIFTIITGLAHSAQLQGPQTGELYEAKVPVLDKSEQERETALQTALRQVIAKITGRQNPMERAEVTEALEHPDRYIQQFLYRTETPSGSPASAAELMFWAKFDPDAIDELLRSANLPIWGSVARPSILIWLVLKGEKENVLIGTNDQGELSNALHEGAAERGIPIMLPLLDLDDFSHIDETDVLNRSRERILAASERYAANTILAGRVYSASATRWKANWELFGTETTLGNWTTHASEPGEALRKGIHKATDILVNRHGASGRGEHADTAPASAWPTVSGINTIADYARTLRYLESLQPEAKVYVTQAIGNSLSFRLSIPGGDVGFARMVEYGATLTNTIDTDGMFTFRLLP